LLRSVIDWSIVPCWAVSIELNAFCVRSLRVLFLPIKLFAIVDV
jgi:hypothetical protein